MSHFLPIFSFDLFRGKGLGRESKASDLTRTEIEHLFARELGRLPLRA